MFEFGAAYVKGYFNACGYEANPLEIEAFEMEARIEADLYRNAPRIGNRDLDLSNKSHAPTLWAAISYAYNPGGFSLVSSQCPQLLVHGSRRLLRRDDDDDGMPDEWEREHGLDPFDAADASLDSGNDDYTNL